MCARYGNNNAPLDFYAAVISSELDTRVSRQKMKRPKFRGVQLAIEKHIDVATVFSRR